MKIMKIKITSVDPELINISTTNQEYDCIISKWDIEYKIIFYNVDGSRYTLTGTVEWKKEILDLKEVRNYLYETYKNLKQLE